MENLSENVNLVMSLTGAKYIRVEIEAALKKCLGDADEAIDYLIN